jgi:hypothetical protein
MHKIHIALTIEVSEPSLEARKVAIMRDVFDWLNTPAVTADLTADLTETEEPLKAVVNG